MVAFYQDDTLVSASLINGYTLNKTRLASVRADVINLYNDNSLNNEGDRIPTLLKIDGHLTLEEAGQTKINSLKVYLPSTLSISNFIETDNLNSIGCSTWDCFGYLGGL